MRLSGLPYGLAAAGGIAHVPDSYVARQAGQAGIIEDLRHQPQVLRHRDRATISHRDARTLLPAMLQGLQTEAGHARYIATRRIDAEYTAFLFRMIRDRPRGTPIAHRVLSATSPATSATWPSSTSELPNATLLPAGRNSSTVQNVTMR